MSSLRFILVLMVMLSGSLPALAQTREEGPWWPHPVWGAGDEAGASNWITPEKILEALSLVKTGTVYELGHLYERGMPLLGDRTYAIVMPGMPTAGPIGDQRLVFNDEFIAGEIGQVGTQFDGMGHVGQRVTMADGSDMDVYYNGHTADEMASPIGLQRLGVENIKPIITRGILIDLAGYKGVDRLPEHYEATLADVRGALERQGMSENDLRPGDALLFNFGWWSLWPDPITHNQSVIPGIDMDVVQWIIGRQPAMVGSDLALDGASMRVHPELTLKQGIGNLEFMNFGPLMADEGWMFLLIVTPLRLKGATGSPSRPIAIR